MHGFPFFERGLGGCDGCGLGTGLDGLGCIGKVEGESLSVGQGLDGMGSVSWVRMRWGLVVEDSRLVIQYCMKGLYSSGNGCCPVQ